MTISAAELLNAIEPAIVINADGRDLRQWVFNCCNVGQDGKNTEPYIYAERFHSAGFYNASMSFGKHIPMSLWDTKDDKVKRVIKAAFLELMGSEKE